MALIHCPECNKEISSAAEVCPNCGYPVARANSAPANNQADVSSSDEKEAVPFEKKVSPLSEKVVSKKGMWGHIIGGLCCISVGIPLVSIFIGVLFILVGVWELIKAAGSKIETQNGDCPYCGVKLTVHCGQTAFRCPVCNNVGQQTGTSLISTHAYNNEKTV